MDFKAHFKEACLAKHKELKRKLLWEEVLTLACLSHDACLPAVKPRAKAQTSTDSDWITDLEQDPALAGIDVKKQLGMAQFWCRNNSRLCTRKFFVNWLGKADRIVTVNADGKSSKVTLVANIYQEPEMWEHIAARLYNPDIAARMKENGWMNLSPDMRNNILRNAK